MTFTIKVTVFIFNVMCEQEWLQPIFKEVRFIWLQQPGFATSTIFTVALSITQQWQSQDKTVTQVPPNIERFRCRLVTCICLKCYLERTANDILHKIGHSYAYLTWNAASFSWSPTWDVCLWRKCLSMKIPLPVLYLSIYSARRTAKQIKGLFTPTTPLHWRTK